MPRSRMDEEQTKRDRCIRWNISLKNSEIPTHAEAGGNCEDIMPSETRQSQEEI